jgi:hypothetical protein
MGVEVISMLTLTLTVMIHLVSTVWWAASITRRVEHIEKWISHNEHTAERLAALEQRIDHLNGGINRIELFLRQRP